MSERTSIALSALSFQQYEESFKENDLDDEVLQNCDTEGTIFEDLKDVIPSIGHRRKFITMFRNITFTPILEPPASPATTTNSSTSADEHWAIPDTLNIDAPLCDQVLWDDPDTNDSLGVAIIYIDNSNIFINSQQHSGKQKGFLPGVQDVRCRIDTGKLVNLACQGKKVLSGKLYGSEPPALDTVWRVIRRHEIEVHTSQKNFQSKEKETDTSLCLDALEDCMKFTRELVGPNRTFILFSGDRDMLPLVQKVEKYGWNVHVWSYKKSLCSDIGRESRHNECVKIFYIDDVFEKFTFCETQWNLRIPRERSLVLEFSGKPYPGSLEKDAKNEFIRRIVDTSAELFKLPTQGTFLTERHFALVICRHEKYHKFGTNNKTSTYDFNVDVWTKVDRLKKSFKNCKAIQTYVEFHQNRDSSLQLEVVEDISDDEGDDFNPEIFFDHNFETVKQKTRKNHTKSSDPCPYRFWCNNASLCRYTHSEQEKEYFKKSPQIKSWQRKLYKSKFCTRKFCDYSQQTYLCPFAHDLKEARCLRCRGVGLHWTDECPLNQKIAD